MKYLHSCLLMLLICGVRAAIGAQLAFFYALEADRTALEAKGGPAGPPVEVGSRTIHRLRLGPHRVLAVRMGSGCLETALSAQALLARFRCDAAYSIGPAGALNEHLVTGTWHRVERVYAWQQAMGNVRELGARTNWVAANALLHPAPALTLASGEEFIDSTPERERVQALAQADAVDMNLYGLALACQDHRVPLVAWKIISDHADEQAADDFRAFRAGYDGAGGAALADLILTLPPDPADPLSHPAIERALRED